LRAAQTINNRIYSPFRLQVSGNEISLLSSQTLLRLTKLIVLVLKPAAGLYKTIQLGSERFNLTYKLVASIVRHGSFCLPRIPSLRVEQIINLYREATTESYDRKILRSMTAAYGPKV
jgi:hypothetical protein